VKCGLEERGELTGCPAGSGNLPLPRKGTEKKGEVLGDSKKGKKSKRCSNGKPPVLIASFQTVGSPLMEGFSIGFGQQRATSASCPSKKLKGGRDRGETGTTGGAALMLR